MKYIENVLERSYKRTITIYNIFMFAIMFIIFCAVLNGIELEGMRAFIAMLIMFVIYTIIYILIKKYLVSKYKFENTKMYNILEKRGYKEDFFNTINTEINSKTAIKYYNSNRKVGLIMTPTWFILISHIKPEIRKTCEIHKISEELSVSVDSDEYGKFMLVVEYKDNTYFFTREIQYDIEEIQKEIKEKYPDVLVGRGIIDDNK